MPESLDYAKPDKVRWTCGKCKISRIILTSAEGFTTNCNCGRVMVMHKGYLTERKTVEQLMTEVTRTWR